MTQLFHYPAVAEIDLDALEHNAKMLRQCAPTQRHMGIVKADAYGHGRAEVAVALAEIGYSIVGVAQLAEALEVRDELDQAGFEDVEVFSWILPPDNPALLEEAAKRGIQLSVSDLTQLLSISALEHPARIYLKIDTGMGRAGAPLEQFRTLATAALRARERGVETLGVWSHLARADEDSDEGRAATARQVEIFEDAVAIAKEVGLRVLELHLAASSGEIWHPETHYDMVRDGIALYGLSPDPSHEGSLELGLHPVMTLKAQLVQVKHVRAGQTVSYGGTWTAKQDTWLAIVPLGYGDGIPRHASGRGPVRVYTPETQIDTHVVGRVCMDQFVIDLGPADEPPAAAGDWAVLFGNPHRLSTRGCPTADDWARASDTINYEIVTRLGARVPRSYIHPSETD